MDLLGQATIRMVAWIGEAHERNLSDLTSGRHLKL
jgi:hypothetical protein